MAEVAVPRPDPGTIAWSECGEGLECGTLAVPLDHAAPAGAQMQLALTRHLARTDDERIGSLLVNPGGPGVSGLFLAEIAESFYGDDLLDRFDIVAFDPRGVGKSTPTIDCIDDYDPYFSLDPTPDTDTEREALADASQAFADACAEKVGTDVLAHTNTVDAARDLDLIRRALGEDRISFFGFSYGSELGAVWATLFPDTVRAAVLDGAADPTAGFVESGLQQSLGFENTLATFLQQCSEDSDCAFHNDGDAEGAFDALMLTLDETPAPSEDGRPDTNLQVAVSGVIQAMYSDQLWPDLAQALADAQNGDGAGLLALYDQYYGRGFDGTYENSLEAFQSIYCMDTVERPTVAEDDAVGPEFQAVAPRISPGTTGSYFCTFFPESTDPWVAITGRGAGPILVMGTTGDSATPLAGTRVMADSLEDGRLVVVTANQHTGYSANACAADTIEEYLIDPVGSAPTDGAECP